MFMQPQGSARVRCLVNSKWRIMLDLIDKSGRESRMSTGLFVCNRHRCQLKPVDILDDLTWSNVQRQMATKGYLKLRRTRTRLSYTAMDVEVVEKVLC